MPFFIVAGSAFLLAILCSIFWFIIVMMRRYIEKKQFEAEKVESLANGVSLNFSSFYCAQARKAMTTVEKGARAATTRGCDYSSVPDH